MALYADIIELVAPGEAQAGSRVDITVRIKNTYSSPIGIMAGGALEFGLTPRPQISFPAPTDTVQPGSNRSFGGNFVMPDMRVTIHSYSYWYGSDGYWHFDDEMTKIVDLAALPESQFGSIEIASYERRL